MTKELEPKPQQLSAHDLLNKVSSELMEAKTIRAGDKPEQVYTFTGQQLIDLLTPVLATTFSMWRDNGEPDPHGTYYNSERAKLAMGYLTDDKMANAAFMFGDTGHALSQIAYLTAAKERIRWLSRKLYEVGVNLHDTEWQDGVESIPTLSDYKQVSYLLDQAKTELKQMRDKMKVRLPLINDDLPSGIFDEIAKHQIEIGENLTASGFEVTYLTDPKYMKR